MTEQQAYDAIVALETAYAECLDEDRLEDWPAFFVRGDCRYEIVSRENYEQGWPVAVMLCDSQGMLQDRVIALRNANIYAKHYYRHLLSHPHIEGPHADGMYRVRTNYAVFQTLMDGETHVYQVGKYEDVVQWEDGQPRFKEKRVIYDTARVQTLLATPV